MLSTDGGANDVVHKGIAIQCRFLWLFAPVDQTAIPRR